MKRVVLTLIMFMSLFVAANTYAQAPAAPPPAEDRLDQCDAERGGLVTERARLNYQLREALKVLAAEGFEVKEGRWVKKAADKKAEPEKK